ncbi:coiled-coil domain-containing protein 40 [Platysternon megacephalum]|uniref:Coiled-coil domain-containing protein 40 n=1 Tax=Platysternon megacephalum TaxID=55544 RepID=A0A4D9E9G1_9SAUR|nr:coiled-coil domain-containing protein 40 [Platysternon megacephalum]
MWLEERPLLTHQCKLLEHLEGALPNADQVGAVPKPNYIPPLINYHLPGCSGTSTDAHLQGRFYFWGLISSVEGSSPSSGIGGNRTCDPSICKCTSQIKTNSQGFL